MKTVAIVGGGPAGLVAAKTLIRSHPNTFEVAVFEKQSRVGGMWAVRQGELHDGKCNPEMPTNLSRFTVAFSDLSWESVDLASANDLPNEYKRGDGKPPLYPRAWQVGRYAQEYAKRYLPQDSIFTNCQVTQACKAQDGDVTRWEVEWSRTGSTDNKEADGFQSQKRLFDYLIVASGFFNEPRGPNFKTEPGTNITALHSTQFRVIEDLVPEPIREGGKIVVIGGSMSGTEAAAAVAMALSNSRYRPNEDDVPPYSVHHVAARPFYDVPRLQPVPASDLSGGETDHSPAFIPGDLSMFSLSNRPRGDIIPSNGLVPPSRAKMSHAYMQSVIGGDQSDLASPCLTFSAEEKKRPPFMSITENYTEFVRSGDIVTVKGRAVSLRPGEDTRTAILQVQDEQGIKHDLDNVIGVVHATGFNPHAGLRWLDPNIRVALGEDQRSMRVPLLLQRHAMFHPSVSNIAFVGFYEGAFWAVMEMQAREIATRWGPDPKPEDAELGYAEPNMQELRSAMLNAESNVPQFWMRDYLAIVEALAKHLGISRSDDDFGKREGPVVAARYSAKNDDPVEIKKSLLDLTNVLRASSKDHRFVSAAIFRGLQGSWYMIRQLESALPSFPAGTFTGTASFHPRLPTADRYSAEYLYVEEGKLETHTGLIIPANKRYAYRYSEEKDMISVWFVKSDGMTVDYFFHEIDLKRREPGSHTCGWLATGTHLCEKDNYDSSYEFCFRGATLQNLSIKFVVKGPQKDYVTITQFARP